MVVNVFQLINVAQKCGKTMVDILIVKIFQNMVVEAVDQSMQGVKQYKNLHGNVAAMNAQMSCSNRR